jgi:hypothetical protein
MDDSALTALRSELNKWMSTHARSLPLEGLEEAAAELGKSMSKLRRLKSAHERILAPQ